MKFSKVFFAALLAVVVGAVVSGLFWLFTILGLVGSMGKSKAVAVLPNTILRVDLADNIVDSPMINPLANLDFTNIQPSRTLPLLKVLRAIETAATDERIKGIYLNYSDGGSVSSAALEEAPLLLNKRKLITATRIPITSRALGSIFDNFIFFHTFFF